MSNFLKLMASARKGDAKAQHSLGLMFYEGDERALMFFEDMRC